MLCNPSFVRIPFKAAWPDPPQWVALPLRLTLRSLSPSPSLSLCLLPSRSLSRTWAFGKLQLFDKFESFVIDTNSFQIAHTTAQPTDETGEGEGVVVVSCVAVATVAAAVATAAIDDVLSGNSQIQRQSARRQRSESSNGSKQLDIL